MTALLINSVADEGTLESPDVALRDMPSDGIFPKGWEFAQLTTVAQLESGHTPSRNNPEYWGGDIPWLSLHDTDVLDELEVFNTSQTVTQKGIDNSSARVLPRGTVVFSRTATVGKATVLGREMATSQDFACYICGPRVHNHFLVYLFRHMAPEWRRYMAGSTHNTVYMPVFRTLRVPLPPRPEQEAIAEALRDADALIESVEQLIAKKRAVKQGAMQDLLSGRRRLPGFSGDWTVVRLGDIGETFGGLTGKNKGDFGQGNSRYITFMNVINNVVVRPELFDYVAVKSGESQNKVLRGDLLFNGSSETPEEVGMCSLLAEDVEDVYLNSFCFGYRLKDALRANGLYLAYFFRSGSGRELLKSLAQGATRYNLSKRALLKVEFRLPAYSEQCDIAKVLSEIDEELAELQAKLAKARQLKQGMMQELLTGRVRLV